MEFVVGNLQGMCIEEDLGVEGVPLQFGLCVFYILQIFFLKFSILRWSDSFIAGDKILL